MSILKPTPEIPQVVRNLCPVCGKTSYSRDGVHPQCSLDSADAIRYEKIRARRKDETKKAKPAAARRFSKTCPGCGAVMHVRLIVCSCGHSFSK